MFQRSCTSMLFISFFLGGEVSIKNYLFEFSFENCHNTFRRKCRYFLEGKCTYGDTCRFDHDVETKPAAPMPPTPPAVPVAQGPQRGFRDLATWCTPLNKTCSVYSTPKKQDGFFYKRKPADIYVGPPWFLTELVYWYLSIRGASRSFFPLIWLMQMFGFFVHLGCKFFEFFLPWKEFVKRGTPTEYA